MRIRLLEDINDDYLNIHFKKDNIYPVLGDYMCGGENGSDDKILRCVGHGVYIYARKGTYEIVTPEPFVKRKRHFNRGK